MVRRRPMLSAGTATAIGKDLESICNLCSLHQLSPFSHTKGQCVHALAETPFLFPWSVAHSSSLPPSLHPSICCMSIMTVVRGADLDKKFQKTRLSSFVLASKFGLCASRCCNCKSGEWPLVPLLSRLPFARRPGVKKTSTISQRPRVWAP